MKNSRFEKKNRFWEIYYIDDINEIIVRTGAKKKPGRIYIYHGFDGDEWIRMMQKKINLKRHEGWKKTTLIKSADDIVNIRLKKYDYEGRKIL